MQDRKYWLLLYERDETACKLCGVRLCMKLYHKIN